MIIEKTDRFMGTDDEDKEEHVNYNSHNTELMDIAQGDDDNGHIIADAGESENCANVAVHHMIMLFL